MSVTLPLGCKRVVLDLDVPGVGPAPRLGGFLLSLVRASGVIESGYIGVAATGLSRPFGGFTWEAEWSEGERQARLRVGIPDAILAASFDPVARFHVEAVSGADTRANGFAALSVTLVPSALRDNREWPAWVPAEMTPSMLSMHEPGL